MGLTRHDSLTDIAHRGYAGCYPENSLMAVERACAAGADIVEVDVMPAGDGTVVVCHDSTPARVTDATDPVASTPIWETPLVSLRDLAVLGTNQRIPLLREVVDVLPPAVGLNVELKHPGTRPGRIGASPGPGERSDRRAAWDSFAGDVLNILAGGPHDVLVSSFYDGALAALRAHDPDVALAAVFWESIAAGFGLARRHDCTAVHVPWNMIAGTPFFGADYCTSGPFEDVDVVEVAHAEGRDVNVWTVETWTRAAVLESAGVDGLIADYPGLCSTSEPP